MQQSELTYSPDKFSPEYSREQGGSIVESVEATGNRVRSFLYGTHETTSWNGGVVLRSRSMQKKIQLKYRGVPYTKNT